MLFEAPEVVTQIKEVQFLYKVSDKYAKELDKALADLEKDLFFDNATEKKIVDFENFLKITKNSKDSLEDRRLKIKTKVFQKLPYTTRFLKRYLDSLCGNDGYKLDIDVKRLELYCFVEIKSNTIFRNVYNFLDEIVPLNMLLLVMGHCLHELACNITTESSLCISNEFYYRYNLRPLVLNGTWKLEGRRWLNGYHVKEGLDFYPVIFTVIGRVEEIIKVYNQLLIKTKAEIKTLCENTINLLSDSLEEIEIENQMKIQNDINYLVETDSILTIEFDLWFLDGNQVLDGSRLLDAEVCKANL